MSFPSDPRPPYASGGSWPHPAHGQSPQPLTASDPVRPDPAAQVPGAPPRRLSAWVWPAVALLALTVGFFGGAVSGSFIAGTSGGDESGGVLAVERRTAAPLPAENDSIAKVAEEALPSTLQVLASANGGSDAGGAVQGDATGSAWVFDANGHVITNNHVVAAADKDNGVIQLIDQDGRRFRAEIVGRSTIYDIAVLRAEEVESLTPLAIGSADQMRVGEGVVAIGSPLGLSATVTSGIVSALNRPVTTGDGGDDNSYINAVQTDAAINPGNSGGPLVDFQGQVIGVNSAIASTGSLLAGQSGGNIGVGFAIPIEQVQITTDQILRTGKARYPVIGANVRGTDALDGAQVESIQANSPASRAGLRKGDLVQRIDGKPVTGAVDLIVAIRSRAPGEKVSLTVARGAGTERLDLTLDSRTED